MSANLLFLKSDPQLNILLFPPIALAQVFKLMGSLEVVEMPQNGIYYEGLSALADAFVNNPNLRILNMSDNTFNKESPKAMAEALEKLQKLEVLNFGDCLLKTEGARFIAYAIKKSHPNLREWNMESNEIRLVNSILISRIFDFCNTYFNFTNFNFCVIF